MQEILAIVQSFLESWGIQSLFLQVFILGAICTLPIGPWSVVAMDQTKKYGKRHGLIIAIIATVGTMTIAAATVYSFTWLYPWMHNNLQSIYMFTSILLLIFGFVFLFKKKEKSIQAENAPTPVKDFAFKILAWCGIQDELAEKVYARLSDSHKFTYLVTFIWCSLHPGNILTYSLVCLIIQSLGHDFAIVNIPLDYLWPLLLSTAFMWIGWVLFGKLIDRFLFYIVKGFGILFVFAGIHMFYTYAV
jgi:arginine exporter protein ArgO